MFQFSSKRQLIKVFWNYRNKHTQATRKCDSFPLKNNNSVRLPALLKRKKSHYPHSIFIPSQCFSPDMEENKTMRFFTFENRPRNPVYQPRSSDIWSTLKNKKSSGRGKKFPDTQLHFSWYSKREKKREKNHLLNVPLNARVRRIFFI